MRGLKEILLSFTLGFAALYSYTYLQRSVKVERQNSKTTPTNLAGLPEDAALSLSWGLSLIEAPRAWRKQKGNSSIVVAVIDTGADIHHPALQRNIWRNPGEVGLDENGESKATNGRDDDDNGFVDDVHGWNFASSSPEVMDDHGHGTHIAGIIAGPGVAPDVSLMILKYYDTEGSGEANLRNTIKAMRYAVRMGAKIINYSGGGVMKSREEQEMIAWAREQGVLVVAAAGNEGMNSDFFHFYPASYELDNIVSVAATDRYGQLLAQSNHGIQTVDLGAPGKNIYSTLPGGQYGYMTGTSQATAFVSGAAALMIAQDARLSRDPARLIRLLSSSGQTLLALEGKTRTGRILNVDRALSASETELAQGPNSR